MPIRQLSPLLVNQIAAGEVIERPASVVKELVENAIDAGATRIDVTVEDGGRELIRIADDGCGIPAEQLPLALAAHATSKIEKAEDLARIVTMGFRGEALASIASVSRLRMTSRSRDAEAGAVIESSGPETSEVRPAGCAPGTLVEVRNLFFNTPARRKFMRTAPTEFGQINDTLSRIALAHPRVGFKLTHNNRTTWDRPPVQTPAQRALSVLGEDLAEALLEFDSDERGVELWGMAALPTLAKSTARYQYVYVNGRPVRDRNIMHAIKEAYRGLIEPGQQPMLVLFVTLDPEAVDVNVHPTKSEVRFADSKPIHGAVLATIRQRLLAADLTPRVNPFARKPGSIDPAALNLDMQPGQTQGQLPIGDFPSSLETTAPAGDSASGSLPPVGHRPSAVGNPNSHVSAFVNYFRRMDPTDKGVVYEEVRREMAEAAPSENDALTTPIEARASSVLQVHNSYIVTQDETGIVIIDQHALHERMMFEGLYERIIEHGTLESQRLLTPAVVKATPGRLEALERLDVLLEKIGIEAAPIGPAAIGVQAFATLLFERNVDPVDFMEQLLDRAADEAFEPSAEAALHEVLDMMSCKAAVKAGDSMAPDELGALLQRRENIERASNCPHGRPTTIRLSIDDLEKHFKRT